MDIAECIPDSIWEKILKQPTVSAGDFLSFCSSCRRFREFLLHNAIIWRWKFAQKWPFVKTQLDNVSSHDWFELYRQRNSMISETKNSLDALSARYIGEDTLHLSDSAFVGMAERANHFEYGILFLIDEFRHIINETLPNLRLTDKYYAWSAVRYFTQESLIPRWNQWRENGQNLEIGAWLFAQWFQPNSTLDEAWLTNQLDTMVEETKQKVSERNKRHPLLHRGPIVHQDLHETIWSVAETREIIDALNFVFVVKNDFRGNAEDYYCIKNSFLNEVIRSKLGIPITLCILYHAVARRLGVICSPVGFPAHFLLKFVDQPDLSESQKYTYIDVFNSCRLMREDQVWATHSQPNLNYNRNFFAVSDSITVLVRMINNIAHVEHSFRPTDSIVKRSAWELGVVLKPMDFEMRLALARKYFRLDVNIEKIVDLMEGIPEPTDQMQRVQRQHFIEMARARLLTVAIYNSEGLNVPKLRSQHTHVKFATGLIMRHKQYNYTCVITGWDPVCAASDSWKTQMGVQNLPRKDRQPFYHVLVHDGTNRYAAEENMVFEPNPVPVTHPEIGKFFDEFSATHYKMNNERKQQYPEDEGAVADYVQSLYRTQNEGMTASES